MPDSDRAVLVPSTAVEVALARFQAWIVAALAFMFVCAVCFLGLAVWVVTAASGRVAEAKAKSDEALACYVQPQLDRAEATLPALDYYKSHPEELADQLANIRKQRRLALTAWGSCERIRQP